MYTLKVNLFIKFEKYKALYHRLISHYEGVPKKECKLGNP